MNARVTLYRSQGPNEFQLVFDPRFMESQESLLLHKVIDNLNCIIDHCILIGKLFFFSKGIFYLALNIPYQTSSLIVHMGAAGSRTGS